MRILLLTEYLPASADGEITGGVEAYCHYVARYLRADHDVVLLGRDTDGSVWDDASLTSVPGRLAFLGRAFLAGLRDPGDIVVGTTYVVHPLAWLVARIRRRPVVFWYPDVLIGTWRSGRFGRLAGVVGEVTERLILKLPVDRYLAISESTASKLREQGIPAGRITVVPCGFDADLVGSIEPERQEGRRLLSVGRLVRYKRPDVVVRGFARLATDRPDLNLVVIGQGPEQDRVRDLARSLGVGDRVELRGFVTRHADVLAAMGGATAFVSASEVEGFGIVLAEAMALGVPYAASDIPAFREVTDGGVGGALFPPGDDAALAEALAPILDDPEQRALLGGLGRSHSARYRWDRIADQTAGALQRSIDEHGKRTTMDLAPMRELRRLTGSVRFHLADKGARGLAAEVGDVVKAYATYPFLRSSWEREPLVFQGRELRYYRHHYNRAWRNERSVELALALDFLQGTPAGRTLEVGNVLSHYVAVRHDILDKYEESPGVLNDDIVDFRPDERYERVVSISTLEHVGWDERPRDPEKVLLAYKRIRDLVREGGSILLTCPFGQNPHLDEYLHAGQIDFPVQVVLKRVSADNRWVSTTMEDVRGARYGSPYRNANALFVGLVPGEAGWGVDVGKG